MTISAPFPLKDQHKIERFEMMIWLEITNSISISIAMTTDDCWHFGSVSAIQNIHQHCCYQINSRIPTFGQCIIISYLLLLIYYTLNISIHIRSQANHMFCKLLASCYHAKITCHAKVQSIKSIFSIARSTYGCQSFGLVFFFFEDEAQRMNYFIFSKNVILLKEIWDGDTGRQLTVSKLYIIVFHSWKFDVTERWHFVLTQ